MKRRIVAGAGLAIGVLTLAVVAADGAVPVNSTALRAAVSVGNARLHQFILQGIADDNGGIRLAGTQGYDDSAEYVAQTMMAMGLSVSIQPFEFVSFRPLGPSDLEQTAPVPTAYVEGTDFEVMAQSEPGDITASVTGVDLNLVGTRASSSGCEAADFAGFPAGNIALIQRGTCTFQLKAENAAAAGAVGAIIFNQGNTPAREGIINGTLQAGYSGGIPVMDATFARGAEWANTAGLIMRIHTNVERRIVTTHNVIAETPGGRSDRVVVVGAHLDSVPTGPGIQDNGTGSAALLEIATQMAKLRIKPRNKVRFAWWSAEESGLIGSQFYVDNLTARGIKDIAVNINLDMIGSPNPVRFVYDGDGSATPLAGPNGSKNIEQVFLDYFASQGMATEPTAFDGRSDYGPFIAAGIPAGGLFTGAEGVKSAEEAAIYGGTAGEPYDPCYHLACDNYDNIDEQVFEEMLDASAHAVLSFAMTTSAVNGTDKGSDKAMLAAASMEMLGSHARQ